MQPRYRYAKVTHAGGKVSYMWVDPHSKTCKVFKTGRIHPYPKNVTSVVTVKEPKTS